MTIQGTGGAAATSVAIPTHAAGDLIWVITRAASNTAPTKPTASGTVPNWTVAYTGGANTLAFVSAWFVATASTTTTGAWTGASHIAVIVLRPIPGMLLGVNAAPTGTANGSNSQTIDYPSCAPVTTINGSSSGLRMATRGTAATSMNTPPTGWTNQLVQPSGAGALIAVHTFAPLTQNIGLLTVSLTGTTNAPWRAHSFEITEKPPQQRMMVIT